MSATVGLGMMMNRVDINGTEIWPEERIGLEDAIRAYTWNGAYASFEETIKGSLEPGKLGDVTIFETDLRNLNPAEIGSVRIDATISDGQVVTIAASGNRPPLANGSNERCN